MKRKLIVLLVVVAMLVSATGCSKKTENKDNPASSSKGTVKVDDTTFNESGYPIVKEPLELSAVFQSHPLTYELMEMGSFQSIAEKTGISLNVEAVRSGWDERKNLILASSDLPDIFFGEGLKDTDIFNNKEYFVDMAPLIDKYAPNIKKMFEEDPVTKKICTDPDTGAIYGLPSVRPLRPKIIDGWYINKQWLDQLGLEIPQTLDEFEAVLKAFKENDPNQNGKADEVPFYFNKGNRGFSWRNLLGSYGITNDHGNLNYMQVRDGEVQFTPVLEGYRDAIDYVHKLYAQGLIYPEVLTQADYGSVAKSPEIARVGVATHWTKNIFGPWQDQYVQLPPLEGPNGHRQIANDVVWTKYKKNVFSITTANKNPEATMRWVDELYSEENSIQMFFGSFDVAINKTDSGYDVLDPPADLNLAAGPWKWTAAPADRAPMYCGKELEAKITAPDFHTNKIKEDIPLKDYIEPAENMYPIVSLPPEVSSELAILINDIITGYVLQKTDQWIAEGGVMEEWDNYIKQINKMGYDRLMEIYQDAYDKYMAN